MNEYQFYSNKAMIQIFIWKFFLCRKKINFESENFESCKYGAEVKFAECEIKKNPNKK